MFLNFSTSLYEGWFLKYHLNSSLNSSLTLRVISIPNTVRFMVSPPPPPLALFSAKKEGEHIRNGPGTASRPRTVCPILNRFSHLAECSLSFILLISKLRFHELCLGFGEGGGVGTWFGGGGSRASCTISLCVSLYCELVYPHFFYTPTFLDE